MIRECCECKIIMGEKEPYEDRSVTSGLCDPCLQQAREKIRKFHEQQKQQEKEQLS